MFTLAWLITVDNALRNPVRASPGGDIGMLARKSTSLSRFPIPPCTTSCRTSGNLTKDWSPCKGADSRRLSPCSHARIAEAKSTPQSRSKCCMGDIEVRIDEKRALRGVAHEVEPGQSRHPAGGGNSPA